MDALTIGVVARRADVGVETVRFYERQGLVARPPRPRKGYRTYPEETVERIRFVRHAQALGFTLEEIAALLALRVTAGANCAAVRSRAAIKLTDVETKIAKLVRIRDALEKLVAACPGRGAIAQCTILEALDARNAAVPNDVFLSGQRRQKGSRPMKSLEVKIAGMHCDGCASTIKTLLSHEPGVKSASVSFAKGSATVLYDPQDTNPEALTAAIEKAGFRATGGSGAVVS